MTLASCVLTPGRFTSTLRVDANGRFAFTYVGEVYALDVEEMGAKARAAGERAKAPSKDSAGAVADAVADKPDPAKRKAETDAKNRAMAAALAKEAGYRKVSYEGDGRFLIDYAIVGTLDHAFVFPYNTDAEAVFPFVAIEPRQSGVVRVKAPGFANDSSQKGVGLPGADQDASRLDGTFTLDTNAAIVSQNSEDGASLGAAGRHVIVWKATPLTRDAPTAVLKLR